MQPSRSRTPRGPRAGNGATFAFSFDTRDEASALHALALGLGARTESDPGKRGPNWWMSYFRDLDGNRLCAFSMG